MADGLLEADAAGFQMQSWSNVDGSRAWVPMEDGPGRKVWLPRSTAAAAVQRCLEWTGLGCIPAMRVVDLSTGDVVWSEVDTSRYPDAGPSVLPGWADAARAAARAALEAQAAAEAERPMPAPRPVVDDGALFSLEEVRHG